MPAFESPPRTGTPTLDRLAAAPLPDACPNCGAEQLGAYCHACGQHHLDGRLTVRRLWREFASRVFNLNRGLVGTFVGLTKHPGLVPLEYVRGRRRRYTNPLSYLLLASAFSLFMLQFSEDVIRQQAQEQFAEREVAREHRDAEVPPTGVPHDHDGDGQADHADDDPALERFRERMDEIFDPANPQGFTELWIEGLTRYNTVLTAFLCIPLVLLLRLLFGSVRNVAEITVFALYVVAHATFLASLASYGLVRVSPLSSLLSVVLYIGLVAWAAVKFWGEGFSAAWRAAVAMTAAYGAYYLVVVVFALIFVFDTLIDESGYSWGAFLGRLYRGLTNG